MFARLWGFTTTARVQLEHGAHVDLQDVVRDFQHVHMHTLNDHLLWSHSMQENGMSALMLASGAGHQEIVAVLLEYKAQANLVDKVRCMLR